MFARVVHRMGGVILALGVLTVTGCSSEPSVKQASSESSARDSGTAHKADVIPKAERSPADSPAFESPEEAVRAWHKAYAEEGIAGHMRTTFHQSSSEDDAAEYEALLADRYAPLAAADNLEVLEIVERSPYAAVIVRGGDRVDFVCLYEDAAGWHVSRRPGDLMTRAITWSKPSDGAEYQAGAEIAAIATIKAGQWAKGSGEAGASLPAVAVTGGSLDSPAFESPEKAVAAWLEAYKAEGEPGHKRLTFDETNVPVTQWSRTLTERFEPPVQAGTVEILETVTQGPMAAVIVRRGSEVDHVCVYRDAAGWHVSRTLVDWDTVAPSGDASKDRSFDSSEANIAIDLQLKERELAQE